MLTIVPAKIPRSDLCRSFNNSGTVTKPSASARRLMLGSHLEKLLLPYCCQGPSRMIVGSSLFIGFAGKIESRRANSNRFPAHYE